jgi:hypothetical protein
MLTHALARMPLKLGAWRLCNCKEPQVSKKTINLGMRAGIEYFSLDAILPVKATAR